ncbi:hypothetical protein DFH09DRAFT_1213569, partial [Mycena vulgaris]
WVVCPCRLFLLPRSGSRARASRSLPLAAFILRSLAVRSFLGGAFSGSRALSFRGAMLVEFLVLVPGCYSSVLAAGGAMCTPCANGCTCSYTCVVVLCYCGTSFTAFFAPGVCSSLCTNIMLYRNRNTTDFSG